MRGERLQSILTFYISSLTELFLTVFTETAAVLPFHSGVKESVHAVVPVLIRRL